MADSYYTPGPERSANVNALFRRIAGRYDLINDLQSLGLHRRWKRRVAELARVKCGDLALDLCCGTGDICLALACAGADVVGLDFTTEMLDRAQKRRDALPAQSLESGWQKQPLAKLWFLRGDALKIPFADNTFDAVTIGYGLRNLADWKSGIEEMHRVVKPGGRIVVLEFGKPQNALWRAFYQTYLRAVVPAFGLLFYGNPEAYRYILESLDHYPSQIQIADFLRKMGLVNVQLFNLLAGAMSIHCAEKR
jgi:demethylmenaquinone methyltransferase/2-methoxy-6-polyprenyl-1,4-benzoquinol methylase